MHQPLPHHHIYNKRDKCIIVLDFIKIQNFGCFAEEHRLDFKKLNIIVGQNNSGKSTIFKALNLFRIWQTASDHSRFWDSDYYSLVDFDSVAYDSSRKFSITVGSDDKEVTLVVQNMNTRKWISGGNEGMRNIPQIELNYTYINSLRNVIAYQNPTGMNYRTQTQNTMFTDEIQDIYPDGRNMIRFLVEKWTAQDPQMELFEKWLSKIDPQIELFATPVLQHGSSLSVRKNDGKSIKKINMHFQGDGIQNAITIIAAVIFSPKHSAIIIEEPELYQHGGSIEILVDLFNYAVNELDKQIIIVTHSLEIIKAYCSDIGEGTERGNKHVKANKDDFELFVVDKSMSSEKIKEYKLIDKKYSDVRKDFKVMLG